MSKSFKMFKDLDSIEEKEFRKWARENYEPLTEIKGVWHPTIQEECAEMNKGADPFGISPILHDIVKEIFNKP